jgi:hypothetical protein
MLSGLGEGSPSRRPVAASPLLLPAGRDTSKNMTLGIEFKRGSTRLQGKRQVLPLHSGHVRAAYMSITREPFLRTQPTQQIALQTFVHCTHTMHVPTWTLDSSATPGPTCCHTAQADASLVLHEGRPAGCLPLPASPTAAKTTMTVVLLRVSLSAKSRL